MVAFCPHCGNLLLVEQAGQLRFFCPTCPYVYQIKTTISKVVPTKKKIVDDVLGGPEAWKAAQKTAATCEKCSHKEAYYMQMQIRSADEPMTTFFKCCNETCGYQWRDG